MLAKIRGKVLGDLRGDIIAMFEFLRKPIQHHAQIGGVARSIDLAHASSLLSPCLIWTEFGATQLCEIKRQQAAWHPAVVIASAKR